MSRGRAPTVIPPRLLTPRTWTPATPTSADSMGTPTMVSASSTARRMELTARSRFTIWPLRQPFDSAAPSAANRTPPSSSSSPTSAQVLALPMSSATMCRSFFVKSAAPWFPAVSMLPVLICKMRPVALARMPGRFFWRRAMRGLGRRRARRFVPSLGDQRAIRIHHRFSVETQINGFDAASFGAPVTIVLQHGVKAILEIAVAEMHDDRGIRFGPLIIRRAVEGAATLQIGNGGAQIFGLGQVHFAHFFHRPSAGLFRTDGKAGEKLHAFFAIIERHGSVQSGDHRTMKVALRGARQDHAVDVDEFHLIAGAEKSDRRAFGNVDFDGIGQRAAYHRLLHPGQRFDLPAALVEVDTQHAVVAVHAENFPDAIGSDVVSVGNLNLVGMNQGHGFRRQ